MAHQLNSQLIKLAMLTLKHSFKIVIICIIGVVFSSAKNNINTDNTISNQDPLLKKDLVSKINEAFKEGEILSFRLHYGLLDAGAIVMEVKPKLINVSGRQVYHIVGNGYTKGTFDWFFKVRDRYETFIDKDALLPWMFVRRVNEGGYITNQDYSFLFCKKFKFIKRKRR